MAVAAMRIHLVPAVIIATGNDPQYRRLCELLELPALGQDPRFATNAERIAHREELTRLLTEATLRRTKAQLLAACEAQGVPAGPINDLAEVFADPQVRHRRIERRIDGVPSVAPPFHFSDATLPLDRPSPGLGQPQGPGGTRRCVRS